MVYRIKIKSPFVVAVSLLLVTVILSIIITGNNGQQKKALDANQASISTELTQFQPVNGEYKKHSGDMQAVWVSYLSLSLKADFSEQAFKENFDNIIKTAKEHKINTLIVHVRPFGDALYPSKYYPWSHILTGTQGNDPGYDPLKYMIEATHNAGLEFQAWINPLRIKSKDIPKTLCDSSLFNKWSKEDKTKDYVLSYEDGYYLNPAIDQVRETIINGVQEIVENYAVDGIHFDDYFYPTEDSSFDKTSYKAYLDSLDDECVPLTLNDWRCANINKLIAGVYGKIHSITNNVEFGISPQCNINNDINMGADVYSWCSTYGYIDYVCPQLYVNFDHALLPFNTTADKWKKLITNNKIKFYIGLAVYKAGSDVDDGTWEKSNDILKQEIEYGKEIGVDGFMLYDIEYLVKEQTQKEVENVMSVLN